MSPTSANDVRNCSARHGGRIPIIGRRDPVYRLQKHRVQSTGLDPIRSRIALQRGPGLLNYAVNCWLNYRHSTPPGNLEAGALLAVSQSAVPGAPMVPML
jgi:hypothetical protein